MTAARAAAWVWLLFTLGRWVYRRGFDDGFTRTARIVWDRESAL